MSQQIFAPRVARSLFSLRRYLIFFLFIAFVVSACFLLFLRTMHFESTNLARSALLTLGNVILLSLSLIHIYGGEQLSSIGELA